MPLSCRNIALIKEALKPQVLNYTSHGAAAQTSFFYKNQSDKRDFCKLSYKCSLLLLAFILNFICSSEEGDGKVIFICVTIFLKWL